MKEENIALMVRLETSRVINLEDLVGRPITGVWSDGDNIILRLDKKWALISMHIDQHEDGVRYICLNEMMMPEHMQGLHEVKLVEHSEYRAWLGELNLEEEMRKKKVADAEIELAITLIKKHPEILSRLQEEK